MKITALALSALGLANLYAAHNSNDPLILNNRTGLDPVVYDTFTTSYTAAATPKYMVSVPVTPSPIRSNTFLPKPGTSIECWRNDYPCGQNGGQRSQRLAANFVRATPALDARVPPPEWFSTRPNVDVPGQTDAPGETGDLRYGILPIPTSLGGKQYDAPLAPGKTSDSIFSILPISSFMSSGSYAPISTEWWRGPEGVPAPPSTAQKPALPSDWWRGPAIPSDWFRLHPSIPSEWLRPAPTDKTSHQEGAASSRTINCSLHWCPSGTPSASSTPSSAGLPVLTAPPVTTPAIKPTVALTTSSHFAIPAGPEETIIDTYIESATSNFVVPPKIISPVVPPTPLAAGEPYITTINCSMHYCPSGMPTVHTITPPSYTTADAGVGSTTRGFAVPPSARPTVVARDARW